MLITFRTKAAASVTLFADPARDLLRMMGQTAELPGGVKGKEVGPALDALRAALAPASAPATPPAPGADEDRPEPVDAPVALSRRAVPLIDLLERARKTEADVYWVEGA